MRPAGLALAACVLLAGCAGGSALEARSQTVSALIAKARDHGARRCAPVELATAESHREFTRQDLSQGNYHGAKAELDVAEENAHAAIEKSPKHRCNPEVAQAPDPKPLPEQAPMPEPETEPELPVPEPEPEPEPEPSPCPDVPEDYDGPVDEEGCPTYEKIVVTEKKIELNQSIHFETAKSTIQPRSYSLLDEVVKALTDRPELRVRIEGHTDSRGRDGYNQGLSEARASSVRDYLIDHGIASDRMISRGYGEDRPIADNRTAAGREQNRRVEFVILNNE